MKVLTASIALVLAAATHLARADTNTIAVAQKDGVDIELYDTQGACLPGERGAAKSPIGDRYHYVMACWHIEGPNAIVRFEDGTLEVLKQHQMVPVMRSKPML